MSKLLIICNRIDNWIDEMLKNKTILDLENFEKYLNIKQLQFDPLELLIEYKTSLQFDALNTTN